MSRTWPVETSTSGLSRRWQQASGRWSPSELLQRPRNPVDELSRLRKLFPEGCELDRMGGRGVRSTDEVADRRARELGDATEPRQRRRRHLPLPARDGDGLDPELVGELLLRQARTAPRRAQPAAHTVGLVGCRDDAFPITPAGELQTLRAASATAHAHPFPAAIAPLIALGEEEGTLAPGKPVPEEATAQRHGPITRPGRP